jgi:hypothetical protein
MGIVESAALTRQLPMPPVKTRMTVRSPAHRTENSADLPLPLSATKRPSRSDSEIGAKWS